MSNALLSSTIIDKIDDLKGTQITTLDVKEKSSITDCMIICTGTSRRHVISIAEHVATEMKKLNVIPLGTEGEADGEWVVVDFGDVMVHVMQEECRETYQLEKLWSSW